MTQDVRKRGVLDPKRPMQVRRQSVVNLWDFLVKGGIADTTRQPSEIIDTGRTRELHRYAKAKGVRSKGLPVLLVPPLGAQASCFDLRRGLSLAEELVNQGRPTYLVDYGPLTGEDRKVGIEHFVNDVLPPAIRKVSEDAGGKDVHLIGWCMGGLLSIATTSIYDDLPIRSVAMVASPFDTSKIPTLAPIRAIGKLTDGRIIGTALKAAGSVPAPLVSIGFKATALPTYLKKPRTLWNRREDREFLGQIQAVDVVMNNMLAYPGRATLQVYQRMALRNELATGKIQGPTHLIDLAKVTVPVMNIAGKTDVLVPQAAAHHVGTLLTGSPDVRLPVAPGGHLGVLTGTQAPQTTWQEIHAFLNDYDRRKKPSTT
ncbi:alpha/beta fold hydrolase [Nocardioides humilatus]|uniref:Alpha/beta fold hydrolase n=1 Tax=Nocardioides humilatus TaxID=2607660 RepID=A0A5B1LKC2_9ACTN|nr:alpha/beta fold hydrolase [Nocardioides humilatus]KAA1420916.1 alpha/beta fold hydrolase [Nocardioides humilatus]